MLWYCVLEVDNIGEQRGVNISKVTNATKLEKILQDGTLVRSRGIVGGRNYMKRGATSEYSTGGGPAPLPRVQYW